MRSDLVIGVSGGIGVGKTTFISALAAMIDATVLSFGAVVRAQAKLGWSGSHEPPREFLQRVGEDLITTWGPAEFTRRVLVGRQTGRIALVDGVRHVSIVQALEEAAGPDCFSLIFLEASDDVRRERLQHQPGLATRLPDFATHSTERQVQDGSLRARAKIVLDAARPTAELIADARLKIEEL